MTPTTSYGLLVQRDLAADDRRIGPESPAPEPIAQKHDLMPAFDFLLPREVAAERRLDADNVEEPGSHENAAQPLGLGAAADVDGRGFDGGHGGERRVVAAPVVEVRRRDRSVQAAFARPLLAERHHIARRGIRQRPPEHGVDDAEDRGVGADAEREGNECDERKGRLPPQHPRAKDNVLPKSIPHTLEPPQLVRDRRERTAVRRALPPKRHRQLRPRSTTARWRRGRLRAARASAGTPRAGRRRSAPADRQARTARTVAATRGWRWCVT